MTLSDIRYRRMKSVFISDNSVLSDRGWINGSLVTPPSS